MTVNVTHSEWYRSTHSGANNNCLETRTAAYDDGATEQQVRDSKNPNGGHISFHPQQWAAFLDRTVPVRTKRAR